MNQFRKLNIFKTINFEILFWIFLPSFLVTFLIWFPFGLNLGGLIEEWDVLRLFINNGPLFWVGSQSVMAAHQLRPLTVFPQALGYFLDPNSFFYWHLILFASVYTKGLTAALISWFLFRDRLLTLIAGPLFIVMPADTMQLSFRGLHINLALALLVLGVFTGWRALLSENKRLQWVFGLLGTLLFVLSCLMYEAGVLLTFGPILLLLVEKKFRGSFTLLKKRILFLIIWGAGTLFVVFRALYLISRGGVYQTSVTGSPGTAIAQAILKFKFLFRIALYHLGWGQWNDSFYYLLKEKTFLLNLFVFMVILSGFIFYAFLKDKNKSYPGNSWFPAGKLIGAGFLLALFGYLPYLTSYSHIVISQRTYLFAAFGATLFYLGIIAWFRRFSFWLASGLSFLLLLLGFFSQLYQFDHYSLLSRQQNAILQQIGESVPELSTNQRLLIKDESGALTDIWMLKGQMMSNALTYLYGHEVYADICVYPGGLWSSMDVTPLARMGKCLDTPDTWVIGEGVNTKHIIKKTETIEIDFNKETKVSSVKWPSETVEESEKKSVIPARFTSALKCRETDCKKALAANISQHSFRWDFGDRWSLDRPTPGVGFRGIEWSLQSFSMISADWMNEPISNLLFDMEPLHSEYQLSGAIIGYGAAASRTDLKLSINEHPLAVVWKDQFQFSATVSSDDLKKGRNELLLKTTCNEEIAVCLDFDWIQLVPSTQK